MPRLGRRLEHALETLRCAQYPDQDMWGLSWTSNGEAGGSVETTVEEPPRCPSWVEKREPGSL